jgi:hypothetical protein
LFAFLNHWWNLPFLVMLGLVGVFFVLQLLGMFAGDGHGEHDADGNVDGDADADADPDADGDAADHDVHAEHDADGVSWGDILAFFGVGHVPFMVIWVTLFLFTGFSGIFINSLVFVRAPALMGWGFPLVLLASLIIGLLAVRLFSRLAAKVVDTGGKGATKKNDLVGLEGEVASLHVDSRFGEIRVHDARGNEILVHGCTHDGERDIKRGERVLLVDFDAERGLFWVSPVADDLQPKKGLG